MIRFLKDRMSSISSDLYEKTLKPNKSHTNRIIQIVSCKTTLINTYKTISYVKNPGRSNKRFKKIPCEINAIRF